MRKDPGQDDLRETEHLEPVPDQPGFHPCRLTDAAAADAAAAAEEWPLISEQARNDWIWEMGGRF